MYSFIVENNKCKKTSVNKNVVARIGHNEHKDVLLKNRIQSKGHKIGTDEINKISLPCFDDKIHIQNNRYDGLALEY